MEMTGFYFYEYPHVGAYRIRPENICVDKLTHSGVCDTPLHGHFADFHFYFFAPAFAAHSVPAVTMTL